MAVSRFGFRDAGSGFAAIGEDYDDKIQCNSNR